MRLQRFVAEEWAVPPIKAHATDWEAAHWSVLGPVYAWRDARRAWSAVHGEVFGNPLERLTFERATRRAYYSEFTKWATG